MLVSTQVWRPASPSWSAPILAFFCLEFDRSHEPLRGRGGALRCRREAEPPAPRSPHRGRAEPRQTMGRKSHPPPAPGSGGFPHRRGEMFVRTKSGLRALSSSPPPLPRGEGWGRCEAAGPVRRSLPPRAGRQWQVPEKDGRG